MADRTQGIFTIVYPLNTASSVPDVGFGARVRVRSSHPFVIGDFMTLTLTASQDYGFTLADQISVASAYVAGASGLCDLFPGWDDISSIPSTVALAGPVDLFYTVGAPRQDGRLRYFDASFTLIDDQVFTNLFVNEPLTQGPFFAFYRLFQQAQDNYNNLVLALSPPAGLSMRTPAIGFSGSGSLARAGAYGVRVQLSTVPIGYGQTYENPPRLIPAAGSIQFGVLGSFEDSHLVHYADQLVRADPIGASLLHYNFRVGFVATLTLFDRL